MSSSKIRIAFLFLDQMHHVYHAAPTAFELSKDERFSVTLFTSSDYNINLFLEISKLYPEHQAFFKRLDTTFWSFFGQKIKSRPYPTVRNVLKKNLELLMGFDCLVTPDDSLHYIMKRDKTRRLKYITTLHGPGDNQRKPRYKNFDYVLLSGKARWNLMESQGILDDNKAKIVGYPKFDVTLANMDKPDLFSNNNPVVIYNPHADPKKSSWEIWGHKILEYFYQNKNFNLIFAPHIMIFSKRRNNIPAKYYDIPNIHIDVNSKALVDMTYTKMSDIYIGDLSSQVYEFIYNPRPCVFLNAHRVNWKNNLIFKRWYLGDVVNNIDDFSFALLNAQDRHKLYIEKQRQCFDETFSISKEPSARIAANAIADFLTYNKKQ